MRVEAYGEEFFLSIISGGRPDNVEPMNALVGPASWFVTGEPEAVDGYADALADCEVGELVYCPTLYPANRQAAMMLAWKEGLPCVELDDDLVWAKRAKLGTPDAVEIDPLEAVAEIVRRTRELGVRMGGAAPTINAYFSRHATSTRSFVRSGVRVTYESEPRIDVELRLKHDYAFTIDHVLAYGGVCRCDDLLFNFRQRTNAGGVQDFRTDETKEQAVARLLDRYPGFVRRHSTRSGEVSLRLPKAQRTILR